MNFNEWYEAEFPQLVEHDIQLHTIKKAWDAAIDEAVKTIEGLMEGEARDTAWAAYADAVDKTKELKS